MRRNPALIQVLLAQALNASNAPKSADEAVSLLRTALAREPESVDGYTQLAMAYGRKGDLAQADLASALAAFMRGDHKTARQLAARAKTRFPDRLARLGQGRRYYKFQVKLRLGASTPKGLILMRFLHAWPSQPASF